jgi:hypothetical protein
MCFIVPSGRNAGSPVFHYVAAVASMPRDAHRTLLVLVPDDRTTLLVVATQPTLTRVRLVLVIAGSIVTPLALALLTRLVWDARDRAWSYLGLISELSGSAFWTVYLSVAVGLFPLARQDTAKTGVVPSYFGRRSGARYPDRVAARPTQRLSQCDARWRGRGARHRHWLPRGT